MTTGILGILAAAAGSVGAYFAWKCSATRQRREAERKVDEEIRAFVASKAEIERAVYERDDDKLNQIVSKILAPAVCAALCASIVGCAANPPATVYVATDRRIESTTNSIGIACKAVPDPVFAEMLVRLQELDDLKREIKIDRRVSK